MGGGSQGPGGSYMYYQIGQDAYFFEFGVVIMFGLDKKQEAELLRKVWGWRVFGGACPSGLFWDKKQESELLRKVWGRRVFGGWTWLGTGTCSRPWGRGAAAGVCGGGKPSTGACSARRRAPQPTTGADAPLEGIPRRLLCGAGAAPVSAGQAARQTLTPGMSYPRLLKRRRCCSRRCGSSRTARDSRWTSSCSPSAAPSRRTSRCGAGAHTVAPWVGPRAAASRRTALARRQRRRSAQAATARGLRGGLRGGGSARRGCRGSAARAPPLACRTTAGPALALTTKTRAPPAARGDVCAPAQNDVFTINKRQAKTHTVRLAIAHALAQSSKLSLYEQQVCGGDPGDACIGLDVARVHGPQCHGLSSKAELQLLRRPAPPSGRLHLLCRMRGAGAQLPHGCTPTAHIHGARAALPTGVEPGGSHQAPAGGAGQHGKAAGVHQGPGAAHRQGARGAWVRA